MSWTMANADHLKLLRQGVDAWNAWRAKEPRVRPDLSEANLSEADLAKATLSRANLSEARLSEAILNGANLANTAFHPEPPLILAGPMAELVQTARCERIRTPLEVAAIAASSNPPW
jgi:uncharacterized protein YjbI with pentapeptide repeats